MHLIQYIRDVRQKSLLKTSSFSCMKKNPLELQTYLHVNAERAHNTQHTDFRGQSRLQSAEKREKLTKAQFLFVQNSRKSQVTSRSVYEVNTREWRMENGERDRKISCFFPLSVLCNESKF